MPSTEPPNASTTPSENPVEYEHQTLKVIRGREAAKIADLQGQGWEFVSQQQGMLRTELMFRKVKPETFMSHLARRASEGYDAFRRLAPATQRKVLGVSGALLVVVIAVPVVVGASQNGGDPAPSASPSPSPVPSQRPSDPPSRSAPASPSPTSTATMPAAVAVLTAKNSPEFAALLKVSDGCDPSIKPFAAKYEGQTIEFNGSIATFAPHGNFNTRFDFLIYAGDKGPNAVDGPAFQFQDVNYGDFRFKGPAPSSVEIGNKFKFVAKVGDYTEGCLLRLMPVATMSR